jgi:hypothetical protein
MGKDIILQRILISYSISCEIWAEHFSAIWTIHFLVIHTGLPAYTGYSAIWNIILSASWFWVWYFDRLSVWYSRAAGDGACWWWFWLWYFAWYSSTSMETTTTGYASTRAVYIRIWLSIYFLIISYGLYLSPRCYGLLYYEFLYYGLLLMIFFHYYY